MEIEILSETFSLFNVADSELLDWLMSVAVVKEYAPKQKIITDDAWGNSVYFISSGWVKLYEQREEEILALDILGRGGMFGEVAVLDEAPRNTHVIALTKVSIFSVSAQRFLQFLFKDPQVHHRMLKLVIQKLSKISQRWHLIKESPLARIAHILLGIGESFGNDTGYGLEIFNLCAQEIADLCGLEPLEVDGVLERMVEKGWLQIDRKEQIMTLANYRQYSQLTGN